MQQHIAHCWWTLLRSWSSLASYYYNEAHISVDFRPIDQRALHINTKVHFIDDVASMAGSSTAPGSIPRICFWSLRWLLYASFMPFEVNLQATVFFAVHSCPCSFLSSSGYGMVHALEIITLPLYA